MESLEYGLNWDRDHLLQLGSRVRHCFWPLSVFLLHPMVLFVLITTRMDHDCKITFVVYDLILLCFDVYNCLFYQLYTLLPYPVFCCTGILCDEQTSPRLLLGGLAFWTVAQCVPYLFVMMRTHQKMLIGDSPLKLSNCSQGVLMLCFSLVLVSNVYGFGAWSVESTDKEEILQIPSILWARNQSRNFLVFGKQHGDIGLFDREIYLLLFSIIVCFSFYVAITYHAVYVIGKQAFGTHQRSKTYQIQLRFMISMSIQACVTSIMFILPLIMLFLSMATPLAVIVPAIILTPFRFILVVLFSCCSIGHSIVFLCKSAWCIQIFRRMTGRNSPDTKTGTISFYSLPSKSHGPTRIG